MIRYSANKNIPQKTSNDQTAIDKLNNCHVVSPQSPVPVKSSTTISDGANVEKIKSKLGAHNGLCEIGRCCNQTWRVANKPPIKLSNNNAKEYT